ncbi:MAG: MMPL family transporter [Chloroflexi bacterium]|nr:MMPL family transporter [Chloroflexota bacterium]
MSRISTESLARSAAAHPWRTLLIWAAAVVTGVLLIVTLLGSATTFEGQFTNDPDSQVAQDLIEERIRPTHADEVALFRSPTLTVDDAVFRSAVEEFTERTRELGSKIINFENESLQITNFYETGIDAFVSENRKTTLVPLTMAGDIGDASDNIQDVIDIAEEVAADSGIEVLLTGPASIGIDFQKIAQEDLIKGESIGIAIALVILLLVFRAAGSAWIPIVVALISIMLAIAAVSVIGQISEFSFFVTNIITMVGLAVGIDYSLFIIARFREERARGLEKHDAIGRAGATATRAVVFSGITVVLALFGMVMVPTTVFFSIGLGAVLVTIITVIAALTMLPAILSLIGDRVNAWKLPFIPAADGTHDDDTGGFWNTVTRIVMGHPWPALIIVGGLLVAATIPYFGIKTGAAGIDTLPDGFRSLQAFNVLREEFPGQVGGVSAADIVIDGDVTDPEVQAGIERLRLSLEGHPIFGASTYETSDDGVLGHTGDLGRLKVVMPVDSATTLATDAISELRETYIPDARIPADVFVGGQAAINRDFFDLADRWTPIVITFVLALSFVFLLVVFRSIIVPIKAILLNLLSVGAAYGLLVLVLQEGVGNELFGFQQVETIEAWLPVFLFSILFGLSMDYEVFLLSRIRERYDQTGNNADSVAFGLRSTAGIITGAALIMVAVFGGFALGDLVIFQEMGFGLGVAILVDATLIRAILVPASMKLLGDKNWYFPKFLEWLPDLRVDGGTPESEGNALDAGEASPTLAPTTATEVAGD